MPPLVEKSLAPEAVSGALEKAEELKLFSLEEFAELLSVDLETAATLLAPFAALLGIDLDLDTTNTHFNPAETQQVSTTFGHCDAPAAAPAEKAPENLNAVTDGDVVYAVPDDYHGVMPENAAEERKFDNYLHSFTCEELETETEELLEFMRGGAYRDETELRLDRHSYRMARDILDYKRKKGMC